MGSPRIRRDVGDLHQRILQKLTEEQILAALQGLIVSREYDEMRLGNLRAAGRAARDAAAAGL